MKVRRSEKHSISRIRFSTETWKNREEWFCQNYRYICFIGHDNLVSSHSLFIERKSSNNYQRTTLLRVTDKMLTHFLILWTCSHLLKLQKPKHSVCFDTRCWSTDWLICTLWLWLMWRVRRDISSFFNVNKGVGQCYVIAPSFIISFMSYMFSVVD